MAIKLNVGGIDVTVSSPAEAAALLRELQNEPATPPEAAANGKDYSGQASDLNYSDPEVVERTLRFLTAIEKHSPKNAKSAVIMEALRAASPKAVGSKSVAVNKLLLNMGFRKGTVYKSVKKPDEPRLWIARGNLGSAISILNKEYDALKKSGALQ